MKKVALICLLLLSSCTDIKVMFGPPSYEHCGTVDVLEVFRREGGLITCEEAMTTTKAAYELLWSRGPGTLNENWRVEFMWGAIDASDPWGRTTYEKHLIQVQEKAPSSIFHELGHAFMFENHSGGRSQHRKMCTDKNWRQLEQEFEVKPYCHLVGTGPE